jgi:tetrahydromethanopterin S-methyltransferase subunit G
MAELTNELLLEVLKAVQTRLTNIENGIVEVKTELQAMRGHMLAIQTDIGNLYAGQANMEARLTRIERRLELVDTAAH